MFIETTYERVLCFRLNVQCKLRYGEQVIKAHTPTRPLPLPYILINVKLSVFFFPFFLSVALYVNTLAISSWNGGRMGYVFIVSLRLTV